VEDGGLVDTEDVNEVLNPDDVLEALDADDVEHPLVAPSVVVADIPASASSGEAASIDPRAGLHDSALKKVDQGERREAIWRKELTEGGTWGLAEGGTRTKGVEKGTHADRVERGKHTEEGRPQQPRPRRRRGVAKRPRQHQVERREGGRRNRSGHKNNDDGGDAGWWMRARGVPADKARPQQARPRRRRGVGGGGGDGHWCWGGIEKKSAEQGRHDARRSGGRDADDHNGGESRTPPRRRWPPRWTTWQGALPPTTPLDRNTPGRTERARWCGETGQDAHTPSERARWGAEGCCCPSDQHFTAH